MIQRLYRGETITRIRDGRRKWAVGRAEFMLLSEARLHIDGLMDGLTDSREVASAMETLGWAYRTGFRTGRRRWLAGKGKK